MSWLDTNVWDWLKEHSMVWVVLLLGVIVWLWFSLMPGPSPITTVEQGAPITETERHEDTTMTQVVSASHADGKIKGERITKSKTTFHKVFKTKQGEITLDATADQEDTTLDATIGVVDILDVPLVTRTIKESTFQPITKTIEVPNTSGWTWAEIGAGFGAILTVVALFVLRIL